MVLMLSKIIKQQYFAIFWCHFNKEHNTVKLLVLLSLYVCSFSIDIYCFPPMRWNTFGKHLSATAPAPSLSRSLPTTALNPAS